jgi:hypothetical protein
MASTWHTRCLSGISSATLRLEGPQEWLGACWYGLDTHSVLNIKRLLTVALMIWQLLLSGSPKMATSWLQMLTITITLFRKQAGIDPMLDWIHLKND